MKDDPKLWTPDWLRSQQEFLFEDVPSDPVVVGWIYFGFKSGNIEFRHDWQVRVNGASVPCVTRGNVRRLCTALGVKGKSK